MAEESEQAERRRELMGGRSRTVRLISLLDEMRDSLQSWNRYHPLRRKMSLAEVAADVSPPEAVNFEEQLRECFGVIEQLNWQLDGLDGVTDGGGES